MTAHTNDIFIVRSFREYKPIMKNKKNNVSSKYIYSEHFLLSSQGPWTLLLLLLLLFLVYVCVWKSSHIIHANFFPSSHLCCYISTKSDRANKKLCHHRAYFVFTTDIDIQNQRQMVPSQSFKPYLWVMPIIFTTLYRSFVDCGSIALHGWNQHIYLRSIQWYIPIWSELGTVGFDIHDHTVIKFEIAPSQ